MKDQEVTIYSKAKDKLTYKSYSFTQKVRVAQYAHLNSEAEASKRYDIPWSTIYYWKDID